LAKRNQTRSLSPKIGKRSSIIIAPDEEEVIEEPKESDKPKDTPSKSYGELTHGQLTSKVIEMEEHLEDIEAKLQHHQQLSQRSQAELQNILKRTEREVGNARKYALEKFSNELLGVLDSLHHGLEACEDEKAEVKDVAHGMELTLKMFLDVLEKHGVKQIDPLGEKFDHDFHEAISMVEDKKAKTCNFTRIFSRLTL